MNEAKEILQVLSLTSDATDAEHMSRTFASKVLQEQKRILIKDARELDSAEWGTTVQEQHIRSIMGVPIRTQGRVMAVLLAGNLSDPDVFTDVHLRILGFVARVAEIAFQNESFMKLRTLSGMLPICANCKKIRDDDGHGAQLESYFQANTEILFSHGICPECARELYGIG
ncbi:MAG: GAF domain-containing protein [Kiritimatiellae bacterium]|nr:GAF domain-containing protein [Kiritimatiellia bacterium]